jgi:hypothetical protein
MTGVSVTLAYYHKTFSNFRANDNQFVTPADFSEYCITAPVNPRLPCGGGNQICGLYDVNPLKSGQVQNLVLLADHYAKQTEIYNGVDLNFNLNLPRGGTVGGGMNIGNSISNTAQSQTLNGTTSAQDRCFVVDSPQELYQCRSTRPTARSSSLPASIRRRGEGIQLSANFQSIPGAAIAATYNATTEEIAKTLGRPLSGNATSVPIALIPFNAEFEGRIAQLDSRISKRFKVGKGSLRRSWTSTTRSMRVDSPIEWDLPGLPGASHRRSCPVVCSSSAVSSSSKSLSGARLVTPFCRSRWHLLGLEAFYEICTSCGRRVVRGRGGRGAGVRTPAQRTEINQDVSKIPNPYRLVKGWPTLPKTMNGGHWGELIRVDTDRKGNIWVYHRCFNTEPEGAATCVGRTEPPILQFDASGKLLKSFGGGMFAFPHGFTVDSEGNVWASDANAGQAILGKGGDCDCRSIQGHEDGWPGLQIQPGGQGAHDDRQARCGRQRQ